MDIKEKIKKLERKTKLLNDPYREYEMGNYMRSRMFHIKFGELQALKDVTNGKYELDENTSDGYHTFKELYEFRKIYNALLFNEWWRTNRIEVYKSKRHSDGELCFGGDWFIVVAILPTGQISNHYEIKDWDLFKIPECDKSIYEYDEHTPQDTVIRMLDYLEVQIDE